MTQVQLDDPRLQVLELQHLVSYLQGSGWYQEPLESPDLLLFVYQELDDEGEAIEIPLPVSKDPTVNLSRYAETIRFLADFENRSIESVFNDIRTKAVQTVRIEQDTSYFLF